MNRYLDDGTVPIDNNHIENQIRPWALGRKNWLFAGSLRSGQRTAALMSLIQSAKLNGHDVYAYLKDVLTRLPTQRASEIEELLPHRWLPALLRKTGCPDAYGKTVLITGATRGIGLALAWELGRPGAKLVDSSEDIYASANITATLSGAGTVSNAERAVGSAGVSELRGLEVSRPSLRVLLAPDSCDSVTGYGWPIHHERSE